MSSPVESPKDSSPLTLERRLAPHVDGAWAEDFVLELRLLGVAGDRIGAALSEVESHCADSSEGALDAFGDAVTYARSLDLPVQADPSGLARLGSIAPNLLQVVGMLVLLWSFTAWRRGEPLDLTGGQLLALGGGLLGMVAVVRWSDAVIRLVVHHPVVLWCAFIAVTAAFMAPLLLVDAIVARVDTGAPMVLGTIALLGGLAWDGVRRSPADPITSPLDPDPDPDRSTVDHGARTLLRRFVEFALLRALIPLWTIVMLTLTTFLTR